jgi:hypothetical protein
MTSGSLRLHQGCISGSLIAEHTADICLPKSRFVPVHILTATSNQRTPFFAPQQGAACATSLDLPRACEVWHLQISSYPICLWSPMAGPSPAAILRSNKGACAKWLEGKRRVGSLLLRYICRFSSRWTSPHLATSSRRISRLRVRLQQRN